MAGEPLLDLLDDESIFSDCKLIEVSTCRTLEHAEHYVLYNGVCCEV